jgi:hypothetical protein
MDLQQTVSAVCWETINIFRSIVGRKLERELATARAVFFSLYIFARRSRKIDACRQISLCEHELPKTQFYINITPSLVSWSSSIPFSLFFESTRYVCHALNALSSLKRCSFCKIKISSSRKYGL